MREYDEADAQIWGDVPPRDAIEQWARENDPFYNIQEVTMRIPVADLESGMKTPDWEVLSDPYFDEEVPGEVLVRVRHRIDGGETVVAYAEGSEIEVVDAGS